MVQESSTVAHADVGVCFGGGRHRRQDSGVVVSGLTLSGASVFRQLKGGGWLVGAAVAQAARRAIGERHTGRRDPRRGWL